MIDELMTTISTPKVVFDKANHFPLYLSLFIALPVDMVLVPKIRLLCEPLDEFLCFIWLNNDTNLV